MKSSFLSGAAASPPSTPSSFSNGYPTDGDLLSATPPTIPGAWWFHQVTQEILAVVAQAGLTPSATTLTQLRDAILSISASSGPVSSVFGRTGAVTGSVSDISGAAPLASPALTGTPLINGSVALSLANFTGSNQSLSSNGYQKLPGGLILQWMTVTGTVGSTLPGTRSFPTTFPTAVLSFASDSPTFGGGLAYVYRVQPISTSQYTIGVDTWDAGTGAGGTVTMHLIALGY